MFQIYPYFAPILAETGFLCPVPRFGNFFRLANEARSRMLSQLTWQTIFG